MQNRIEGVSCFNIAFNDWIDDELSIIKSHNGHFRTFLTLHCQRWSVKIQDIVLIFKPSRTHAHTHTHTARAPGWIGSGYPYIVNYVLCTMYINSYNFSLIYALYKSISSAVCIVFAWTSLRWIVCVANLSPEGVTERSAPSGERLVCCVWQRYNLLPHLYCDVCGRKWEQETKFGGTADIATLPSCYNLIWRI